VVSCAGEVARLLLEAARRGRRQVSRLGTMLRNLHLALEAGERDVAAVAAGETEVGTRWLPTLGNSPTV